MLFMCYSKKGHSWAETFTRSKQDVTNLQWEKFRQELKIKSKAAFSEGFNKSEDTFMLISSPL